MVFVTEKRIKQRYSQSNKTCLQSSDGGEKSNKGTSSRANNGSAVGSRRLATCASLRASRGRGRGIGASSNFSGRAGGGVVGAVGRENAGRNGGASVGVGRGGGNASGVSRARDRATSRLALGGRNALGLDQVGRIALVLSDTLGDGSGQLGLRLGLAGTGGDLLGAAGAASHGEGLFDAGFDAGRKALEVLSGSEAGNSEGNERGLHLELR